MMRDGEGRVGSDTLGEQDTRIEEAPMAVLHPSNLFEPQLHCPASQ